MKIKNFSGFYVLLSLCAGSFFVLFFFLSAFNPNDVGFLGTLAPLVLIWIFLVTLLRLLSITFNRKDARLLKIASFIVPSAVVLALMFSALGDISILEAILLCVLAALGNFYLARTWPK